jgi:hypothetical protein
VVSGESQADNDVGESGPPREQAASACGDRHLFERVSTDRRLKHRSQLDPAELATPYGLGHGGKSVRDAGKLGLAERGHQRPGRTQVQRQHHRLRSIAGGDRPHIIHWPAGSDKKGRHNQYQSIMPPECSSAWPTPLAGRLSRSTSEALTERTNYPKLPRD